MKRIIKGIWLAKYSLALLMSTVLWVATPTTAQTAALPTDADATRHELVNFDNFLDNHPDLAAQLRRDPSLVNNQEFIEDHAELQQYLQEHPESREEIKENPSAFMHEEGRFDRRDDDSDRRRDRDRNDVDRDRDTTRGELAGMDRFLDSHPEIAEQVRKNPSLVNNKEFVEHHPALQEFLSQHPKLREEFKENPNAFMRQEERFDRREAGRDPARWQLASMDRFLDGHPEIAEQLRKDPSLVKNEEFVEKHPALQDYLRQHSEVREEITENPDAFMRQEQRFDRHEDTFARGDRDTTRGELASFSGFLGSHSKIAEQLAKDPSLAKNEEFTENHPEFQQYLKAHPEVREELTENPQVFMKSVEQFNESSAIAPKVTAPKTIAPKASGLDPKPKQ